MMDPVSQAVSNLGFPIAAYLLIFRVMTTTLEKNTTAISQMTAALQELRETVRLKNDGREAEGRGADGR